VSVVLRDALPISCILESGPSGQFHTAPSTTTHQGAACTRCSHFFKVSSLKNISNTNDQPNCSASVTYPVSSMNLLNSAFVTAVASIKKVSTFILRIGPSTSAGYPSFSLVPIRTSPSQMCTILYCYMISDCCFI